MMNELRNIEESVIMLESMISDIYDSLDIEKRICPVCNQKFRIYLPFGISLRKNAQCPFCQSLERQRTMWLYFRDVIKLFSETNELRILHFAPEVTFNKQFSLMKNVDYYPVDYNPDFENIREVVDMRKMQYSDNMFDIIICNHVLEHIPDERLAIKELHRVLKINGAVYLTVPIDYALDNTLEDSKYCTPELRLKYYGQDDHVRRYGKDFHKRLESAGFVVKILEPNASFSKKELSFYGLNPEEQIFMCTYN